jgi:MoxR-like ATPase
MSGELLIADARQQVRLLTRSLQREFVAREEAIELLILTAVAGEPLLLVGVSGTGKTALVKAFARRLGLTQSEMFDYLITRFTEPAELLGPIDIHALKEGRYIRRIDGKLPTAKVAFIDEIFKANSAILNTLLSILNERVYYQDGRALPVSTEIFIAAANKIAESVELVALKDRFLLKVELQEGKRLHFAPLLRQGMIQDLSRRVHRGVSQTSSLEVFGRIREHLDEVLLECFEKDRDDPLFPREMRLLFERMVISLDGEGYARMSDRSVIKLYRLIRFHAFLMGRGEVQREDLFILSYTAGRQDHLQPLRQRVTTLLELR